ncbi:MAG: alanine racemase [Flavobacteriales bacterium]|nr:alanine racemase [Flavobacteriales bacterium]
MSVIKNDLVLFRGKKDSYLICDFGSNVIESYQKSLDYLSCQPWNTDISVILGFCPPSDTPVEDYYMQIGTILRHSEYKHILCYGKDIENHDYAFPKTALLYNQMTDMLDDLSKFDFEKESVLIKAPKELLPQDIVSQLQRRVHDTVFQINLNAISHNLNYFRSKLKSTTKTMCMVKAKSYGLGDVEIATTLQNEGVDYLGVAYVDEGVNLRSWGIHLPIIVMNPEHSSINTLIKYRLEPEIYSMRVLKQFVDELKNFSFPEPYPIHIKMDTGMHRLGFSSLQLPELIDYIKDEPSIRVASTFSHLVAAEDPREDDFTKLQLARFDDMANTLVGGIGYHVIRHILNTAGIARFNQYQHDMVRLGIGLYGYSSFYEEQKQLKNCATLRTVISQIRTLESGETISYNRRFRVQNTAKIATLPIGYADGINRLWGNGKGYVVINGQKATIVGTICMDMMMVDITGIDCNEGDEVTLIGRDPSAADIAEAIGTIPYEILTNVSDRVKRIYTIRI